MSRGPGWLRDPAAPSMALFVAIGASGFAAMALGWRVAARTLAVALQVPALVSGGLAGLALVFVGAGLATVQVGRRLAGEERVMTELITKEAAALLNVLRSREP